MPSSIVKSSRLRSLLPPSAAHNQAMHRSLGLIALLIGVPSTVIFLPASVYLFLGSLLGIFYRSSGFGSFFPALFLGLGGLLGIIGYWISLILIFKGRATKWIKYLVLTLLCLGVALAGLLLLDVGLGEAIFFVPIIVAGIINTLSLYCVPVDSWKYNANVKRVA